MIELKLFFQKKSLGYQINLGLKEAKGEYFTIVESDDYVKIDMCEKLYRLARNQDCQVVKSDFIGFEDKRSQRILKTSLYVMIKLCIIKKLIRI